MSWEAPAEPVAQPALPWAWWLKSQMMASGRKAEPDLEQRKETVTMQLISTETSCCFLTKSNPVCFYLNNKSALQMLKLR